ncbi:transmembrane protein, putative [Medicago truncatula]|uniref:Transmembrane protein, putative n=1 Tax=Medicago truncatula TaxID=3880 RepID=G7JKU2_MEDTR|nr:transmembrane protein, putative [Medicago truncatula]
MTLVKVYFIKKSRRSSSEDEKEQTTIKISVVVYHIEEEEDDDHGNAISEMKVFSLSDNYLINIQCFLVVVPINWLFLSTNSGSVYLSGTINSLACRDYCYKGFIVEQYVILSVDLSTETYTQLLLPQGFVDLPHYHFRDHESWIQLYKIGYKNLFSTTEFNRLEHMLPAENGDTLILTNERALIYNHKDNRVEQIGLSTNIYIYLSTNIWLIMSMIKCIQSTNKWNNLLMQLRNDQLHYSDCVPQLMSDLIQVIENIVKQQSSSIYVFSSVPSMPLKPLDRRVAIGIDQPSDYVTLQKFTPLTDWSSSTMIKVEAKMMDLESTQHASTFLQWDKGWSLVHWRSRHAWEAIYQDQNLRSSSSEVEKTDMHIKEHIRQFVLLEKTFVPPSKKLNTKGAPKKVDVSCGQLSDHLLSRSMLMLMIQIKRFHNRSHHAQEGKVLVIVISFLTLLRFKLISHTRTKYRRSCINLSKRLWMSKMMVIVDFALLRAYIISLLMIIILSILNLQWLITQQCGA